MQQSIEFLAVELEEYGIKEQNWKVCDARCTFSKVLGEFSICC